METHKRPGIIPRFFHAVFAQNYPRSASKPVQFFFGEFVCVALIIDGIYVIIYTVYFYRSETRHAR